MAELATVAVVLAAHGDRGTSERNAVLRRHAEELRSNAAYKAVTYGVLNGEPALIDALRAADEVRAHQILVYPFFMSGGYFVKKVLPERIEQSGVSAPVHILRPLGFDSTLPGLLLERSVSAARAAGIDPDGARLLIVGHGSKFGRASAEATEAVAAAVRASSAFANVVTAFLEEAPFVRDSLAAQHIPTVVAGFFSAEGMHGHDDVPGAIAGAEFPCVYTRPIGSDAAIPRLIEAAIRDYTSHRST